MFERIAQLTNWLLGPEHPTEERPGHIWARWIFLRSLALWYFSAFYSLLFQIQGLIGPRGILPAGDFLQAVAAALHGWRFWYAPSLFWFGSSDGALMLVCWIGAIASLMLLFNIGPRASLVVCFVCFLSFISSSQDFSSYQSDGMLLEAGFISLFFAPPGFLPGLGRENPPSRASLYLLRWEWFRIYFESGAGKLLGGDPSWRDFSAMNDYYQNGPLPTWIGWYMQHLPHWLHASTVILTFAIELVIVWMVFLPRRFRVLCFCIITPFELGIIFTANYAFLNYLVLSLGILLLDDRVLEWVLPARVKRLIDRKPVAVPGAQPAPAGSRASLREQLRPVRMTIAGVFLGWVFYATAALLVWKFEPGVPLPEKPVTALEPFRIANRYGLFESMTHERYEIEFQGSSNGIEWSPYPFRYKPQDLNRPPRIYAPYQPRFEWNLWFASLGTWRQYRFVLFTEEQLLLNQPDVLHLFAANPFAGAPPKQVRAVMYRYWFTDMKTKREQGLWWRRELLGNYAPVLERESDGKIVLLDFNTVEPQPE
ncbi:MAG TPA: lipase maturation factor family protein [Candidatus Acidoferrales bacterium]|nr:lipase maturation factor family protein [Candidatus Acidoferrales bacterium]